MANQSPSVSLNEQGEGSSEQPLHPAGGSKPFVDEVELEQQIRCVVRPCIANRAEGMRTSVQ